MWFRARQGQLKLDYADWYPWLTPEVWYRAGWLREVVVRQRQAVGPRWEAEPRIPNDEHFLFRGGRARAGASRRTRLTDFVDGRAIRIPRPSGAQQLGQDPSPGRSPA